MTPVKYGWEKEKADFLSFVDLDVTQATLRIGSHFQSFDPTVSVSCFLLKHQFCHAATDNAGSKFSLGLCNFIPACILALIIKPPPDIMSVEPALPDSQNAARNM